MDGSADRRRFYVANALALLAGTVGLALLVDGAFRNSATYDEPTYLRVACRWWRAGDQEAITRMGSPRTFWKLQQAPILAILDRAGFGDWIDSPDVHQAALLPWMRIGSLWIWMVALGATATWAGRRNGSTGMAVAAWLFALTRT